MIVTLITQPGQDVKDTLDQLIIDKGFNEASRRSFFQNDPDFVLSDFFESVLNLSFFDEKKVIVFYQAQGFCGMGKISDQAIETYQKIFSQDLEEILLVFIFDQGLDKRKKLVQQLLKKSQLVDLSQVDETVLTQAIRNLLKTQGLHVDQDLFTFLCQEIDTVDQVKDLEMNIKRHQGTIDFDLIVTWLSGKKEGDLLTFSNHILEKKPKEVYRMLASLRRNNQDPSGVIYLIASKLRRCFLVQSLRQKTSDQELAQKTGMSVKYIWYLKERMAKDWPVKACLDSLRRLATYDYQSKNGLVDRQLGFDQWLIEEMRHGKLA